ncbi:pickpocket protein 19 isoform X2 [Drosophila obscura]|uniref:pickpocket protein 19 isoform X2 n=1 Tax=Drosophila obscura TaxID=7282 RepID=UPI001BB1466F|nr:pickpocket protein 19 isoform X2 [Drosophila obscura]
MSVGSGFCLGQKFVKHWPFGMLLYTKELVAPRPTRGQGLLRFKQNLLRKKLLSGLSDSFAQSTIHGMRNVFVERHFWERCLWLGIVVAAAVTCFSLYSVLLHRHNEQLLVSLIDTTQLPVYHIDFPAVAICPWNHVNWLRTPAAALRFLPRNADAELRETFRQFLIVLEQTTFVNFNKAESLSKRNVTALKSLNVKTMINYLSHRCDELFVPDSCVFDETPYDCCKLFVSEQTEKGQCLVFNSLISEHSRKKQLTNQFYPRKLSTAGEESGLKFTLNLNASYLRAGTTLPHGMNLMIKEPRQWSTNNFYHLHPDTENFVAVHPMVIETSPNTNKMSPKRRRCYFDNEKNPYYQNTTLEYNRANCITVCLHQAVMRICNCTTPAFLPPIEGIRECGILDAKCLSLNADIFSYAKVRDQDKYINDWRRGYVCHCPENCNSRQYVMSLNVRKLIYDKNETNRVIKGQVYYGQRVMTKIVTKLKYTNLDLIANFGGIISLYIGASAISFVELFVVLGKLLWTLIREGYSKAKEWIIRG